MNAEPSQIENLRDNLPPDQGGDQNKPRMAFRTAYILTREQEDALIAHSLQRVKQLEDQLGRRADSTTIDGASHNVTPDPNTFLGKREIFTARYYNHVDDRATPGTIYEQSNITASLSQRITAQAVARANNFFFGQPDDDAWFYAGAVGADDDVLADTINKHARWKLGRCGVKATFEQAVEFGFVRGEAVVKTTHQERSQVYKRNATILIDEETKEPILDAHGDYIVQGDAFDDEMDVVEQAASPAVLGDVPPAPVEQDSAAMAGGPQVPPMAAEPVQMEAPTGRKILRRDGVTVLPENPVYVEQMITRLLTTFEGPDVKLVYFKDFLCPESAEDIQTADLICHLYDMSVMQIVQMFQGQFGEGDQRIRDMQEAISRVRDMANDSAAPKAAANQPRPDFREQDTTGSPNNPLCEIAECYLTYDADGDGIQEEILLILDRRSQAPIFYEYLANVTVKGRRPFEVVRPKAVDGRWYGMGSMEYLDPEQTNVDLMLNRFNFASSGAGRVTFWKPSATVEGASNPNLQLHHGRTYTLRENFKPEDALGYIQVPFDGEYFMELNQLFMQLGQIKSGVINVGDQKISGMPTNDLATGINEVRESGEELFSSFLRALFPGISAALLSAIETVYANLNREEVFAYYNGPDMEQAYSILTLTPDQVRDLTLNVSMVLSRAQERRVLETGAQATALFQTFYGWPLPLQQRAEPFVTRQMKALRVPQAEKLIEPLDPMLSGMGGATPGNVTQLPVGVAQAPGQSAI